MRDEQGPDIPIILRGWSYGGLLALLGGVDHGDAIAGIIAGIPILDWRMLWEEGTEDFRDYIRLLMGGDPAARPELYRDASPLQQLDHLTQPTLLFAAENDIRCPIASVDRYEEEALSRDLPVDVVRLSGGHKSIFNDPAARAVLFKREHAFVNNVLERQSQT